MGYSQEFRELRRRFWVGIGTAAAVALVVGALYFGIKGFNLSRPPERIANTPSVAPIRSASSSDAFHNRGSESLKHLCQSWTSICLWLHAALRPAPLLRRHSS